MHPISVLLDQDIDDPAYNLTKKALQAASQQTPRGRQQKYPTAYMPLHGIQNTPQTFENPNPLPPSRRACYFQSARNSKSEPEEGKKAQQRGLDVNIHYLTLDIDLFPFATGKSRIGPGESETWSAAWGRVIRTRKADVICTSLIWGLIFSMVVA